MAKFWIGQFEFLSLSRPPARPTSRLVREVRPGANGVSYWDEGKVAGPFLVGSVRDTENCLAADDLLAAYQATVGNAQEMGWCGENRGAVMVLGVDVVDGGAYQTLLGIGGILGTSRGLLRCQWVLEYVGIVQ